MAHLTAMKSSLAAVSWSVSQEVGKVGREEGSSGGDIRGEGGGGSVRGAEDGIVSEPRRLHMLLFLSIEDERNVWNVGDWGPNKEEEEDSGEREERGADDMGPGNDLGNIPPEPNKGWEPGNIRGEGFAWGNPKLFGARNPSFDTLGFLGPRSCWTASLFIELSKHFLSRQARHWFL